MFELLVHTPNGNTETFPCAESKSKSCFERSKRSSASWLVYMSIGISHSLAGREGFTTCDLTAELPWTVAVRCTSERWTMIRLLREVTICLEAGRYARISVIISAVLARLGLKAMALARPKAAPAFWNPRPSHGSRLRLGQGLARPRPRLYSTLRGWVQVRVHWAYH